MADYREKLRDDLVEQFREKKNIDALVAVIGKQLNELFSFFEQLKNERSLYTSYGAQLDGIGDIVVLSRAEAGKLMGENIPPMNIDDETYRKYLVYKILKNTSACNYYEMMEVINMFWDGPTLKYSESPDLPATIQFDFDADGDAAQKAVDLPFIKASGVGYKLNVHEGTENNLYSGMVVSAQYQVTTIFPELAVPSQNVQSDVVNYGRQTTVNTTYLIDVDAADENLKGQ